MQFVQLILGDGQALKVRLALDLVLDDPERFVMTDDERTEYERLAVFFATAAANPSMFAPAGQAAQTVKSMVRRVKGPAQPQSGRNKRKARQEKRRAHQKMERKQRREYNEQYNVAMEKVRADMEEAEQAAQELQERYESEPKYNITDVAGNVLMSDVPLSAITAIETSGGTFADGQPRIIRPGTAEALGVEAR